jgi:hypothetical protein
VTATTPVERVAEFLKAAHFRRVPTPLEIAGLQIDVPTVFIGPESSPDLVLVGDTVAQTRRQLQQMVEVVGRALDIKGSRRPLTLVLVGPKPEAAALHAMARVARVLPVGEAADQAALQNWLAVLLPLKLPDPEEARGESASLALLERIDDPIARELVQLARKGEGAVVAERLHDLIDEPFVSDDPELQGGPTP